MTTEFPDIVHPRLQIVAGICAVLTGEAVAIGEVNKLLTRFNKIAT